MKTLEKKFPDGSLSARLKQIQSNKEKELKPEERKEPVTPVTPVAA
jgi:hypothetical protein